MPAAPHPAIDHPHLAQAVVLRREILPRHHVEGRDGEVRRCGHHGAQSCLQARVVRNKCHRSLCFLDRSLGHPLLQEHRYLAYMA